MTLEIGAIRVDRHVKDPPPVPHSGLERCMKAASARIEYPAFFGKMDKPDRPWEAVLAAFLNDNRL